VAVGYEGRVYVSTAVWGSDYIDFFVTYCLPALLAAENLPALSARKGSTFILHTRESDFPRIEQALAYRRLRDIVDVRVRFVEEHSRRPPHETLSKCHAEALSEADEHSAPIAFISPDTIWSQDTFKGIDRILRQGKRVVFVPNLRAVKEEALSDLQERAQVAQEAGHLAAPARWLSAIAIKHLHPSMKEHFFEHGRGDKLLPCNLMWSTGTGDILVRSFHMHPLLVFPRRRFSRFYQTIDGDLVNRACPDFADHYIVTDSDEMTCVEFSARSHFIAGIGDKADTGTVIGWATQNANRVHWNLFREICRLHAGPIEPDAWRDIETRCASVARDVLRMRRIRAPAMAVSDAFYSVAERITGASRGNIQERLFRLRHRISFAVREALFRTRLKIASLIRGALRRTRHKVGSLAHAALQCGRAIAYWVVVFAKRLFRAVHDTLRHSVSRVPGLGPWFRARWRNVVRR
jgi:hypothetical protein